MYEVGHLCKHQYIMPMFMSGNWGLMPKKSRYKNLFLTIASLRCDSSQLHIWMENMFWRLERVNFLVCLCIICIRKSMVYGNMQYKLKKILFLLVWIVMSVVSMNFFFPIMTPDNLDALSEYNIWMEIWLCTWFTCFKFVIKVSRPFLFLLIDSFLCLFYLIGS